MSRFITRSGAVRAAAFLVLFACVGAARSPKSGFASPADVGVDVAALSPVITNPYAAFGLVKRAVFTGTELDDETGKTVKVRVVMTVRDSAQTMAGGRATVVEFLDYDNGELVEKSLEYFAQDSSGAVYHLGARVDDIEGGKVVGHVGQWTAGLKKARAGMYMPAKPAVGDQFEKERAPGVAESNSKVTRAGFSETVQAGNCEDCLETEDLDPASKSSQSSIYCRGKGLVRRTAKTHSLELVELELRPPPSSPDPK